MPKLVIGQPAPWFQLLDLEEKQVALGDYLGRTVLINFWSAECPWAERADRFLVDWKDRIILLSIASNANESVDLLKQEAAKRGLPVVLCDPYQRVADLYGAVTTPHVFLLDTGGILRYQGAFDDITFRQRTATRNLYSGSAQCAARGFSGAC